MLKNSIILGDLHLGKKHKVTYGDPLVWDMLALNVLAQTIQEQDPFTVVLAGDVFDSGKPTSLDFARFVSIIVNVPSVVVLTGNHDLSMVTEDIAFQHLSDLPNVTLVEANSFSWLGYTTWGIGWCDTQQLFEEKMKELLNTVPTGGNIIAHCNRKYWENDNDNSFTDELYDLAKAKNIIVYSGHEHTSSVSKHFIHLGSVVPQARNQTNESFAVVNGELTTLPNYATTDEHDLSKLLYFLEEDPIDPQEDRCYMVRSEKTVKPEDLRLEGKDLTIDIIDSFKEAAIKEGFSEELINAYI